MSAYEMRIIDWSSDVFSSDLPPGGCSLLAADPGPDDLNVFGEVHDICARARREASIGAGQPQQSRRRRARHLASVRKFDVHVRNSVPNGPSHVEVGAGQGSVSRAQCTFVAKNLGLAKEECIDIGADRRHGVRYEHPFVGTLRAERSEEHTSELQYLMRISYAVFCL